MGDTGPGPYKVDDALLARIRHWQGLAPLHNALALTLIEKVQSLRPQATVDDRGIKTPGFGARQNVFSRLQNPGWHAGCNRHAGVYMR